MAGAVASLNALHQADGRGRLPLQPPAHAKSDKSFTPVQRQVLSNVGRAVSQFLPAVPTTEF